MKKVIAVIILFFVGAMAVTCARPTITKEQQDNVVTRIARRYDISEVEFLLFTKNWSTGSYILKLKLNDDDSKKRRKKNENKKKTKRKRKRKRGNKRRK